jgi:hypothetical protein
LISIKHQLLSGSTTKVDLYVAKYRRGYASIENLRHATMPVTDQGDPICITADNGKEFAAHRKISQRLSVPKKTP